MRFFGSYLTIFSNVLFALALLMSQPSLAKSSERQNEFYKIIGKHASGNSIAETKDGYIITGGASDEAGRCCLGWAMKIDKSGNMLWEKKLGENYNDYNFKKVEVVGDRAIIAGATDISYKPQWQAGTFASASGWAVRLAEDGTVEWEKRLKLKERVTYKGVDIVVAPSAIATDAKAVKEDRVIISGFLRYGISDEPILWMLDSKGEVIWETRSDIERHQSISVDAVYPLQGGDFAAAGWMIDRSSNTTGIWLSRIGQDGKVLWNKLLEDKAYKTNDPVSPSLSLTESVDGGIIIGAGQEYLKLDTGDDAGSTRVAVPSGKGSVRLIKLKKNGALEWKKNIETPGICGIKAIWATHEGEAEMVAVGKTCAGEGKRLWAATLSSSGEIKSIKRFLQVKRAYVHQVIPAGDGGLIAVGTSYENEKTNSRVTWIYRTGLVDNVNRDKKR